MLCISFVSWFFLSLVLFLNYWFIDFLIQCKFCISADLRNSIPLQCLSTVKKPSHLAPFHLLPNMWWEENDTEQKVIYKFVNLCILIWFVRKINPKKKLEYSDSLVILMLLNVILTVRYLYYNCVEYLNNAYKVNHVGQEENIALIKPWKSLSQRE